MADESSHHQRRGGPSIIRHRWPKVAACSTTKTAPICNGMARVQSPLTMGMAVTMVITAARRHRPIGLGEVEPDGCEPASVVRHDNSRDRGLWRQV